MPLSLCPIVVLALVAGRTPVMSQEGDRGMATDAAAWQFAQDLARHITAEPAPAFQRTADPGAQWFPKAGLGLFMHWGIHSADGVQPSWAMIKDYPAGGSPAHHPPEKYYALAKRFDPQDYDPGKWMAAAARAGFQYAVLTTKHHDGYALWPSKYGRMSTRQYMGGRDLLRPYVEACREHGLRVGFYFSPTDWAYPGYPIDDVGFDYNRRGQFPPIEDPEANQRAFDRFYAYTVGQLHELLTGYGRIDVLWFDGMGWHGISDLRTEKTLAWVRRLQPGIVINNRWGGVGDFTTPEWALPDGPPDGWWENCISWNGHWGYNPTSPCRPASWALERLVISRSWGGNFLLNIGPAPDGTMPPDFYERCDELASWMARSKESLIGADGVRNWKSFSDVPITRREGTWYLHVLPNHQGDVVVRHVPRPGSVRLLRDGLTIAYEYAGDTLRFALGGESRSPLDEVVEVRWTHEPSP